MKGGAGPAPEIIFNSFLIFSLSGAWKGQFQQNKPFGISKTSGVIMLQLFVENKVEPITVNELLYYFSLLRSYSTRAHSFQHLLFSISFRKEQFYSIRLNLTPLLKYFCVGCFQMFYLLCWMFSSPPLDLLSSDLSFPAAPSPPWQAPTPGVEKFKSSAHKEIAHKPK